MRILFQDGFFTVDDGNFRYSRIQSVYKTGDGVGCQVNFEVDRGRIEEFCGALYKIIKDFKQHDTKERSVDLCMRHGGEPVQVLE